MEPFNWLLTQTISANEVVHESAVDFLAVLFSNEMSFDSSFPFDFDKHRNMATEKLDFIFENYLPCISETFLSGSIVLHSANS